VNQKKLNKMNYTITLNKLGLWYSLDTNFVITPTLASLVSMCKGVSIFEKGKPGKYRLDFEIGELFEFDEVKKDLSRIMDAYILANPSADRAEDKAIRSFASENEQYKFLSNYK